MEGREIVPNERECISQCIFTYWSGSVQKNEDRDEQYERCLTDCNVCASA